MCAPPLGPATEPSWRREGHLLDLCESEDANPAWKRWSTESLKPDGLYGTKPATGGNKAPKLKAIRAALKTADPARRGAVSAGKRHSGRSEDRRRAVGGPVPCRHPGPVDPGDPQGTGRRLPRQGAGGGEPPCDHPEREHDRGAEGSLAASLSGREEAVRCGCLGLPSRGDAGLPLPADDGDAGCPRL